MHYGMSTNTNVDEDLERVDMVLRRRSGKTYIEFRLSRYIPFVYYLQIVCSSLLNISVLLRWSIDFDVVVMARNILLVQIITYIILKYS